MLNDLIRREVLAYFKGPQWQEADRILHMGEKVRHMHIYGRGILHPYDMIPIIRSYFEKRGLKQQRNIVVHTQDRGFANIYNIHPRTDMPHTELYMKFDDRYVFQADPDAPNPTGYSIESWDDDYMNKFHAKSPYRQPSDSEVEQVKAYFGGKHWGRAIAYLQELGHLHCHVPVWTSIDPEALRRIGVEYMNANGLLVDKAVCVVFSLINKEQGKIVFLSRYPDMTLELEYHYREGAVVEPMFDDVTLKIDRTRELSLLDPVPYWRLTREDIEYLQEKV